jgi:hypothetical protein
MFHVLLVELCLSVLTLLLVAKSSPTEPLKFLFVYCIFDFLSIGTIKIEKKK